MLGLKWLAGANITTFACGEISFASRLAVPMTRDLSRGLPLFEAVRVSAFRLSTTPVSMSLAGSRFPILWHEATDRILTPDGCFRGEADIACSCGFDLFDPVSRRSRSIRPRFVPEFPLERNDRHRAARHGHWSPRLAIKQAGRQPARTKCLTDLARSKAQEPDRLCVARRADPPHHVHGRGSQPPDTPRRSRGRERDYAALRYTLPALRSQ